MGPKRVVVVGAGIVGLATAREIVRRHPDATVTVVDKEDRVAAHQTSHNSGVVHAGIYYEPGSLKARLCTRGRLLLQRFCADHGLAYDECGKVVVATGAGEVPALRAIEARATANGVPGLRWLDRAELNEIEPHAAGVAGLHSPHTAIVSFTEIAKAMAAEVDVRLGFEVTSIRPAGAETVVGSAAGEISADAVVICAGLQSDRLARRAGAGRGDGPAIVAFRGEYWRLVPARRHLVRGLIYPVPDPRYPFLGVHFTRRVDGTVDAGPNAVLAPAREGYRRRDVSPSDLVAALAAPGFATMAVRNWRAAGREASTSLSKRLFVRQAQRLLPEVAATDFVRAPFGIRAQALDPDGSLVDDFRITRPGATILAVQNAPSPAATSSLAIAEHLVDELERAMD